MVYGKSARGLPPLKKAKLSKKSQDRHDLILKKLNEYNMWWNDWKFQLNCNKLVLFLLSFVIFSGGIT